MPNNSTLCVLQTEGEKLFHQGLNESNLLYICRSLCSVLVQKLLIGRLKVFLIAFTSKWAYFRVFYCLDCLPEKFSFQCKLHLVQQLNHGDILRVGVSNLLQNLHSSICTTYINLNHSIKGCKYCIVAVVCFSKWVVFCPTIKRLQL